MSKIRWVSLLLFAAMVGVEIPSEAQVAGKVSQNLSVLLDMRPGEWRELPDTKMNVVFPTRDKTTWGVVGPDSVVVAWGGAAYDTKRNAFVFNGGGHTDYGGNEVYAFFLEELRWERLTEPSAMRKLDGKLQYVTTDNTPVSAHTYDGLEYAPRVDRVFRHGGAEYPSGNNYDRAAWFFDMNNRRWQRKSEGGGDYVSSAYDPVRETIYIIGGDFLDEYFPAGDVWVRRLSSQARSLFHIGAIDPVNRKLVTNSYHPGILIYNINPDGSVNERTFPVTQGASEWDKKMLALEYDPVRKVLVAWAGGRDTAYLDSKTLVWRRYANKDSPEAPIAGRDKGVAQGGAGIYGRWRYVPKYDVFIGYNNPRGNIWVWKPASVTAGDTTPPSPPPASVVKPLLENL